MDFSLHVLLEDYPHYQKVVVILKDLVYKYLKPGFPKFKSYYLNTALLWVREEIGPVVLPPHVMLTKVLEFLWDAFRKDPGRDPYLPDYFDEKVNLLTDFDQPTLERATQKLQAINVSLVDFLKDMSGLRMEASIFFQWWLRTMYEIPLDEAGGNIPGSLRDYLSNANLGRRVARSFDGRQNIMPLLGRVFTGFFASSAASTSTDPDDRIRDGVRGMFPAVLDHITDALRREDEGPVARKEAPGWVVELEQLWQDHDAGRAAAEPELPVAEVVRFLSNEFIPWLGFGTYFDMTKHASYKGGGSSDDGAKGEALTELHLR